MQLQESERMSPWDMEPVPEFEESCVVTRSYQAHIKCGEASGVLLCVDDSTHPGA